MSEPVFTHELFDGVPLPGHREFVKRYGASDGDTMNRIGHKEWGPSITAYRFGGSMVVIYPHTVIPDGAKLITASEFHGNC